MTLYLDNNNFTSYVKNRGYTVAYKKVVGPNSFTTLDGVTMRMLSQEGRR